MTVSVDSDRFQSATWKENASLAELILIIILGGVVMAVASGNLIIKDSIYNNKRFHLLCRWVDSFDPNHSIIPREAHQRFYGPQRSPQE